MSPQSGGKPGGTLDSIFELLWGPNQPRSVPNFSDLRQTVLFHDNCLPWYFKQLALREIRALGRRTRITQHREDAVVLPSQFVAPELYARKLALRTEPLYHHSKTRQPSPNDFTLPRYFDITTVNTMDDAKSCTYSTRGVFTQNHQLADEENSNERKTWIRRLSWTTRRSWGPFKNQKRKSTLTQLTLPESETLSECASSLSGAGNAQLVPLQNPRHTSALLLGKTDVKNGGHTGRAIQKKGAAQLHPRRESSKYAHQPNKEWFIRRDGENEPTDCTMAMVFFDHENHFFQVGKVSS
jgi:hypothetical protein